MTLNFHWGDFKNKLKLGKKPINELQRGIVTNMTKIKGTHISNETE